MIYQRALAYLLGLEGVALMRAFAGEHDREFTEARIAEIRRLLDSPSLSGPGVMADRVDTVAGYQVWSATYDRPGNGLFADEEAIVHGILDELPAGTALDAACGTGRHTGHLTALGHHVIGVDSSPAMLERARLQLPQVDLRLGHLHQLPIPDDHVDTVVCGLALTHVPDLVPVLTGFARVLRPGGHVVISDVHHERVLLGSVPRVRGAGGAPGLLPAYRHRASDYLRAALPLGLRVRRCEEPAIDPSIESSVETSMAATDPGPWDDWPWSLLGIVAAASSAAFCGTPALIIWHFQLAES